MKFCCTSIFMLQNDECVHKIKKIVHLIEDDCEILLYFDLYILLVDMYPLNV